MAVSEVRTKSLSVQRRRRPVMRVVWDQFSSFLFVVPFLIAFVAFVGYPIVYGFIISLHHWNPIAGDLGYTGFGQYATLFDSNSLFGQQFWTGLKNTALFVVISVPFLLAFPATIAYLIYRSPLKSLFRSIFFFPTVLSVTAVTSLWSWILQTQGGAVNNLLQAHVPWLVEQPWAWISIDMATLWWTLGFNMIIAYAGFTQLPQSTIEAAALDGAGSLRTFWSIALPQIRPVLAFITVISTISSFNLFAQSLLMTGGGPGSSTEPLTMVIYNQAFNAMHMGSAAAMSYLMALILAIISLVQYRITRERA
ncbi:MAG: sugar ABC transporter permease [Firmicutes bacterium]|nr:sugar ABC transporter permease [Bacillota bacterium]